MSEQDPSIAYDVQKIAEALGSQPPIYLGHVGIGDVVAGTLPGRVQAAKELREVARLEEPTTKIDSAIKKLIELVDAGEDHGQILTSDQKDAIASSATQVWRIGQASISGQPDDITIRCLFDVYFQHQAHVSSTSAGHTLRVLGDDFAIERGFDFDVAWEIYQAALHAHERRPR